MFDPINKQFIFDNPILWIDFGLSILVIAFLIYLLSKLFKTKIALISEIVLPSLIILSWFFGFKFLWQVTMFVFCGVIILLLQNPLEIKFTVGKLFPLSKKKMSASRIFDRQDVCEKLNAAVQNLSKSKTGALITVEMNDSLDNLIKSGTVLNSPLSPELLMTIFYPGTRLHDGAVVIRKDEILAASVYYTPTKKPLSGKYGSRHRAALGVSEITDSFTIIVSEETGRISIAYKGELNVVPQDKLLSSLESYLYRE